MDKDKLKECLYDLSNFLENIITVPSRKRVEGDIYTVYGAAGSGNLSIGTLIASMFLAHALKGSNRDKKTNCIIILN